MVNANPPVTSLINSPRFLVFCIGDFCFPSAALVSAAVGAARCAVTARREAVMSMEQF